MKRGARTRCRDQIHAIVRRATASCSNIAASRPLVTAQTVKGQIGLTDAHALASPRQASTKSATVRSEPPVARMVATRCSPIAPPTRHASRAASRRADAACQSCRSGNAGRTSSARLASRTEPSSVVAAPVLASWTRPRVSVSLARAANVRDCVGASRTLCRQRLRRERTHAGIRLTDGSRESMGASSIARRAS